MGDYSPYATQITLMINALECTMLLQLGTLLLKPHCLSQISLKFCIEVENWLSHELGVKMTKSWNCELNMKVSNACVQVCA